MWIYDWCTWRRMRWSRSSSLRVWEWWSRERERERESDMGHDNDNDNACLRLFDCYYYFGLGSELINSDAILEYEWMNECKLVVQCCISTYHQWMDGGGPSSRVARAIRRCRGKIVWLWPRSQTSTTPPPPSVNGRRSRRRRVRISHFAFGPQIGIVLVREKRETSRV